MPIVSPSPEELHAYQDEELADEELLTDELRRYPTFAPAYKTQYIYVGPMRFEEFIVGHHYLYTLTNPTKLRSLEYYAVVICWSTMRILSLASHPNPSFSSTLVSPTGALTLL